MGAVAGLNQTVNEYLSLLLAILYFFFSVRASEALEHEFRSVFLEARQAAVYGHYVEYVHDLIGVLPEQRKALVHQYFEEVE